MSQGMAYPPSPTQVFSPDVSGTGAAATNTSQIQNLLSAGGVIFLLGSGVAYINATLVIYGNTRLFVSQELTIRMVTGTNGPVLINNGYNARATTASISLAWSSGLSVTATWTGHGRSVGDYIWVSGATQSVFNGIFKVTSVADANTLVYEVLRLPSTSPTGTPVARVADTSITVEGGTWDFNYPNNNGADGLHSHAIIIGGAQNVNFINLNVVNVAKYCFCFGALRDIRTRGCGSSYNTSDLIKGYGPIFNGRFENTWGFVGDDGVSLQTRNPTAFIAYEWTFGDIINCLIDGVDIETTGGTGIVVLYPGANEYMGGIRVRNVGGAYPSGYATAISPSFASSVLNDAAFENINAAAATICLVTGASFSVTCHSISFKDVAFNPTVPTSSQAVTIASSATIKRLSVEGFTVNTSLWPSGAALAFAQILGTVDHVTLSGGTVRTTGAPANMRLLSLTSTAVVKVVAIRRVTTVNADGIVNLSSGMSSAPFISIAGCDLDALSLVTASSSVDLALQGNRLSSMTNGVLRTTSTPTISVEGEGNRLDSGSWVVVVSGTPVINLRSLDFQVDLSGTGINRATGNRCYNTNSALGTLGATGPVICQGTAANSWAAMWNTTLKY